MLFGILSTPSDDDFKQYIASIGEAFFQFSNALPRAQSFCRVGRTVPHRSRQLTRPGRNFSTSSRKLAGKDSTLTTLRLRAPHPVNIFHFRSLIGITSIFSDENGQSRIAILSCTSKI